MFQVAKVFPEQVDASANSTTIYFMLAWAIVFVALLGICFIDGGFVRRKNVLDTWVQKFVAMAGGGLGLALVGFPFWVWQFYQAYGVENAFSQTFKDWWLGGFFLSTPASAVDPAVWPLLDTMQMFFVAWLTYCMTFSALLQGAWLERMKPMPLFILSFFVSILMPISGYLTWGPTSWLTTHGFHEFVGVTVGYIIVGFYSLTINFFLGPRLGYFKSHPSGAAPIPNNEAFVGAGVVCIMAALPFIAAGSTFIFPGEGVFGITMTTTGLGIVVMNTIVAFVGGGLVGCILSYRRKEAIWALVGPFCGFVIVGSYLDIAKPWHVAIISLFGPILVLWGYQLVYKLGVDDPKVAPLTLLPGLAGSFFHGFIYWGTPTGGYPGLTGTYALQSAEITPWWQLIGDVMIIALAVIPAVILGYVLKKTIGLRIDEAQELKGLDQSVWGQTNWGEEPESVVEYAEREGVSIEPPPASAAAPARAK